MRTYGVARNTVQAAMRLLAEAGMVVAHHGKGVYVREPEPLIRLGSDRYSHKYRDSGLSPFLIECERAGKRGRFEVLSIDRVQPPHDVAELLHVDEDTRSVLRRENVFWADDDPVYRVITYIPWTIAQGTGLLESTCRTRTASMACLRSRATRWPGCMTPLSRVCPPSPRKNHSASPQACLFST